MQIHQNVNIDEFKQDTHVKNNVSLLPNKRLKQFQAWNLMTDFFNWTRFHNVHQNAACDGYLMNVH